jgi:hypothetical protein
MRLVCQERFEEGSQTRDKEKERKKRKKTPVR